MKTFPESMWVMKTPSMMCIRDAYASKHSFSVKDIENEVFQKIDYAKSHFFDISIIKKYDQGKFNGFLLQQRKKLKAENLN